MWISPKNQYTNFSWPISIDDKITVFLDRTKGWQLDIADQCINGKKDSNGKLTIKPIKDSGFAVLHIVFTYFEMIAKYRDGFVPKKGESSHSSRYFKQGVYSVFPELKTHSRQIVNSLLDVLYSDGRCALYHSGITDPRIQISSDYEFSIGFDEKSSTLMINPHLLTGELKKNLEDYGERLRDINNSELRENFEKRFDTLFVNPERIK